MGLLSFASGKQGAPDQWPHWVLVVLSCHHIWHVWDSAGDPPRHEMIFQLSKRVLSQSKSRGLDNSLQTGLFEVCSCTLKDGYRHCLGECLTLKSSSISNKKKFLLLHFLTKKLNCVFCHRGWYWEYNIAIVSLTVFIKSHPQMLLMMIVASIKSTKNMLSFVQQIVYRKKSICIKKRHYLPNHSWLKKATWKIALFQRAIMKASKYV